MWHDLKDGSLSSIEIGIEGEDKAEKLLEEHGWSIIERGDNKTPWDIRATKQGDVLAINVKNGAITNQVGLLNIKRLLLHTYKTNEVPAYLFILDKGYVLFSLEEGANLRLEDKQESLLRYE